VASLRVRARHALAVCVLVLAAGAAAASSVAIAQPARTEVAALALTGGRAIEVQATVVGKVERRSDGMLAFDALATVIATGGSEEPVRVEIVIRVDPADVEAPESDGVARALDVGASVLARGTAVPGRPGDRAVLTIRASRGVTVLHAPEGLLASSARLRQGLVAAAAGLPDPGAGLVPGLAVGDTWAVAPELDAAMKESSLSHLTAVSGANCALVVGLAFGAAAALGAGRRLRVLVGVAALAGFVLLVTPEPSVIRAATMAAIAMVGLLLGRPGVGMSLLCLAVSVLLVLDPWLAGSLGFALSATATASLLLFARPLALGLSRHLPRELSLALAVPLAAQLACGPLLVLIAPAVPVYGVIANLLAAPAAPLATVIGLAACLAAPLPLLQDGLSAIAWLPASWIAATAQTMTELPGDLVPWLEDWPGAVALTVVGVAVGVLVAVRPSAIRRTRIVRIGSAVVVALVAGILAGNGLLGSVAGRLTVPSDWSIAACDVGQGDAVLLRSAEAVALIDTGPEPAPLEACLARLGITHIDLLVLSHFDLDHVGGVAAVTGRVSTVLHGPATSAGDRDLVAALEDGGARAIDAHAGLEGTLGDARWRVLWPRAESRAFPEGNDASVVLDVRGGGIPSILLLGDLSASPQRALEASDALKAPYAVVKVAHHGSADQDAALYALAEPSVALVTVGADNDYGHPRAETLAIVESLGAAIARTDLDGLITLSSTQDAVSIWRDRGRGGVGGAG
ncbi:MAG: ComEC/Rec2 family competence protein, partial [Microbacterium sp.]